MTHDPSQFCYVFGSDPQPWMVDWSYERMLKTVEEAEAAGITWLHVSSYWDSGGALRCAPLSIRVSHVSAVHPLRPKTAEWLLDLDPDDEVEAT